MAKPERLAAEGGAGDGERQRPAYPIESVDNALRLLLLLRDQPTLRVAEASRAIGVARSTAHRLLAMLQFHGFVVRDEQSRTYRAGPALVDVGLAVVREVSLREVARPVLDQLAAEVEETVHLAILDGAETTFVDSVESARAVRVGGRIGVRLPAHLTSLGKAMLAALPPERVLQLYPDEQLADRTGSSLRSRSALLAELDEIRQRGFAVNRGESERDLAAIGAAIVDGSGTVRGAISVSAPLERADDAFFSRTEPLLRAAAEIQRRNF